MTKIFDPEVVAPILTGFIDELITSKGGLVPTKAFETAIKPIEEYEGRMRVNASDKFDVAGYIGTVNFYLSQADIQVHRTRGTMVIYMNIEVADKIFKAAGLKVPYDEDDESMGVLCGGLCRSIANAFQERLAASGYVNLEISPPAFYRNSVPEGVRFSQDQNEKQEICFYFLKHKALVIDWTLAPIPKK